MLFTILLGQSGVKLITVAPRIATILLKTCNVPNVRPTFLLSPSDVKLVTVTPRAGLSDKPFSCVTLM